MTEEELMKALTKAARARAADQPSEQWDALAAGELSEAEIAELAANDPEGVLGEMFSPLGDEFVDSVLADVLGESAAELPPTLEDVDTVQPMPTNESTELVDPPAPANSQRWWLAMVPLAAVAAVLIAVFAWPGTPQLPDYAFEVQGGDRVVRGGEEPAPAGVRELAAGSRLTLQARPPGAVDGEVAASVVVRDAAGLHRAPVSLDVSESGAVRWVGTSGQAPLVPGVTGVALVVHRPGASDVEVVGLVGSDAAHAHEVAVRILQ